MLRVLDYRDLRERKGIRWSRPTVNEKIKKAGFPKPFEISERRRVWREDEVDQWLEARAAERVMELERAAIEDRNESEDGDEGEPDDEDEKPP